MEWYEEMAAVAANFLTSAANQPELPLDTCIGNFLKAL